MSFIIKTMLLLYGHFVVTGSFVTPWTVALQAPLCMGFSRQEYRSGLLFPSPEDLPSRGIKPSCLKSPALSGRFLTTEPPRRPFIPATTGCLCPGQKTHAASPRCPLVSQRPELAPRVRSARCAHKNFIYFIDQV